VTKAVGIVFSEGSVVRIFCHGQLVGEITPELWMIDHATNLHGTVKSGTGWRAIHSHTTLSASDRYRVMRRRLGKSGSE
jgi:hypothetical protein